MKSLVDWRVGDSVRSNAHHQQAVEAIRELQNRSIGLAPPRIGRQTVIIGKIVDKGKKPDGSDIPDYVDERYWVETQFIKGADEDDAIAFDKDTAQQVASDVFNGPFPRYIVTATNLVEFNQGTHLLAVDGSVFVMCFAFYDAGNPNQLHYVFAGAFNNPRMVKVRRDDEDGDDGLGSLASSTDCSVTYALYDLDGTAIDGATGMTPKQRRYPTCKYTPAGDDTYGIAFYDENGDIQLAIALDEAAATATIDVPTSFIVDDATHKLQWKLTTCLVLDKGTEGAAIDLYTGSVCT